MGSRYTTIKPDTFCFHPRFIYRDGREMYVPCGKCDGCLLHKANTWSMRLGADIEANRNSIFFTLTYNNKYLPHAVSVGNNAYKVNHSSNIRFDSVKVKERKESFDYLFSSHPIPVTNGRLDCVPYLSKRDIQLWLKSIRKDIDLIFKNYDFSQSIRYFIVGEVGPTPPTHRPHYHGVIICDSHEVSEYLIEQGLYKNWQMCDRNLFQQYTHYCDSGAKGYVTQYLTGFTDLPKVYRTKEIRPFRLSSKSPSCGSTAFNYQKVFEDAIIGIVEYTKDISRLNERTVLRYPKEVINSLFPKCYRFSELSFIGLLRVYGGLYAIRQKFPSHFRTLYSRLHPNLHASDEQATRSCLKWCDKFGCHPHTYVYALDMFYYKSQMLALRSWYMSQNTHLNAFDNLKSYVNFSSLCLKYRSGVLSDYQQLVFSNFLESFGIYLSDISSMSQRELDDLLQYKVNDDYVSEVEDIIQNAKKMPKYNEMTGNSPHIV